MRSLVNKKTDWMMVYCDLPDKKNTVSVELDVPRGVARIFQRGVSPLPHLRPCVPSSNSHA